MTEEKKERLSAHEVAVWLRRHPRFLAQYPDLTLSLVGYSRASHRKYFAARCRSASPFVRSLIVDASSAAAQSASSA